MKTLKYIFLASIILISTGLLAQTYHLKSNQAELKWTAKKVGGSHYGFIKLKEGSLLMDHDQITNGTFVLDMKSISNTDIESEQYKKKLIGHLNSDDFFSTEKFPEATLNITESTPFENNEAKIKGDLTIKGITHPIEFVANHMDHKFRAKITVDRSKYDVKYGSKSFFENLGDKLIYDEFTIDVTITL